MESIINEIRRIAERYHADKVVLFGSRARGDFREKSDIDIAVYGVSDQAAFLSDIEAIDTLLKFDVVFMRSDMDILFLKNIEKDGKIIMEHYTCLFMHFAKAVDSLETGVKKYSEQPDDKLYRDAVIQRFEFTFELAWKVLKEYMSEQGILLNVTFPKSVLKEAYSHEIIRNEQVWLDMLKSRNLTSHTYDEKTADEIASSVSRYYVVEFRALVDTLPGGDQ